MKSSPHHWQHINSYRRTCQDCQGSTYRCKGIKTGHDCRQVGLDLIDSGFDFTEPLVLFAIHIHHNPLRLALILSLRVALLRVDTLRFILLPLRLVLEVLRAYRAITSLSEMSFSPTQSLSLFLHSHQGKAYGSSLRLQTYSNRTRSHPRSSFSWSRKPSFFRSSCFGCRLVVVAYSHFT